MNVRSMTLGSKIAAAVPGGTNSAQEAPNTGQNTANGFSFASIGSDVDSVTTGRLTLSTVGIVIAAMVGFYWLTRNAQGGG